MAVADVNREAARIDGQPLWQSSVERIDIAVNGVHRRDRTEGVQHGLGADVSRMEDLGDPLERLEHAVANQAVRIGDEADYDGPLMTRICDAHCHFLSSRFLELLTSSMTGLPEQGRAAAVSHRLGWDDPGGPDELADRWVSELDRSGVARATLIASIPGDDTSVATAVQRHPHRLIGFFMFNPMPDDAASRLAAVLRGGHLRGVCLFPAMHGYRFDDQRVAEVFATAAHYGAVVFAHCGVLTVGVRKKLGLPSAFDPRLGDPLALAATACRFPSVPVIVPHFGAGMFREALMAADQCGNILFDSSSSNGWMKYFPELTLEHVWRQALAVAGADRILFGTDSSFFPRGWQQPVHAAQDAALRAIGASGSDREKIFSGNFDRLFPDDGIVPHQRPEGSEPPTR